MQFDEAPAKNTGTFIQTNFQQHTGTSALDMITGRNYGQALGPAAVNEDCEDEEITQEAPSTKKRRTLPLRFGCPAKMAGAVDDCEQRFWRAYDVERHLKRTHKIELTRTEVEGLLNIS